MAKSLFLALCVSEESSQAPVIVSSPHGDSFGVIKKSGPRVFEVCVILNKVLEVTLSPYFPVLWTGTTVFVFCPHFKYLKLLLHPDVSGVFAVLDLSKSIWR